MNVKAWCICVVLLVSLASCGRTGVPNTANEQRSDQVPAFASERPPQGTDAGAQSMWAAQKLIRTADLEIKVKNARMAMAAAESVVTSAGGRLADSRITRDANDKEIATISLRVPTARFEEVLGRLRPLGTVDREVVHTEDVTKAYVDLETRLAVKEETATRLRRLLAGATGTLSDVLEVERELGRVTTEIDSLKGERNYYDQRVALSTISVELAEPGAAPYREIGPSIPEALGRSLEVLSTSVAWLIYVVVFLVPWLALASLGWWIVRRLRGRRAV